MIELIMKTSLRKFLLTYKNDLYKHLTFDELLAAVVLTDLDSALYLYTANEYIEIIEGLKFKWSTKKEFPYRKVDLNQRLFEIYMYTYDDEAVQCFQRNLARG